MFIWHNISYTKYQIPIYSVPYTTYHVRMLVFTGSFGLLQLEVEGGLGSDDRKSD